MGSSVSTPTLALLTSSNLSQNSTREDDICQEGSQGARACQPLSALCPGSGGQWRGRFVLQDSQEATPLTLQCLRADR